LLSLDEPLNKATEIAKQIADLEERKLIHRGLGDVVGRIFTDIMVPIIRQYPDLDPTRKESERN
jgi:hypothetical protein